MLVSRILRSPFESVGRAGDIAPAALEYDRSVVGGIFDRPDLVKQGSCAVAREYLAAHYAHAGLLSVTARHGTDAFPVVVDGCDNARHVGAVAAVAEVVGGYDAVACHEIVAVVVAGIAVPVIVLVGAPYLVFIHPHCRLEVRMGEVHSLVQHCHDHGRVARGKFPGLPDLDVRTCGELGLAQVSLIHQMPLVRQEPVVEIWSCGAGCGLEHRRCERNHLAFVSLLELAVVAHSPYLAQHGKPFGHLAGRD